MHVYYMKIDNNTQCKFNLFLENVCISYLICKYNFPIINNYQAGKSEIRGINYTAPVCQTIKLDLRILKQHRSKYKVRSKM